ncbi:MBL fold metallo-hydrolase [Desulfurococcaceae archaeon MEX13E-LK6-19]|nr:MBL fold metallo-hydrolase [Desulfurococcaceae archaeon MEX13E-LK6-19]
MVTIRWFGHACFAISTNGYTIVIDPHDGSSIGLPRPDIKADLVLVSHDHFDHNAVEVVSKETTRVLKMFYGEADFGNIKVKGIKTFHDKYNGRRRGENTIYIVNIGEYKIAHLGDLGHIPSEEVLNELKDIDVLMIPVGGVYTIDYQEAWSIVEKTLPKITVPMHYWVKGLILPLHPIDDFLALVKKIKVVRKDGNDFILEDELMETPKIIILKPPT